MARSSIPPWHKISVSRKEAAELTGLSLNLIDQALQGGTLAYSKHGRRIVILRSSLTEWIERDSQRRTEAIKAMPEPIGKST